MTSPEHDQRQRKIVKIGFGVMAIVSVLAGLFIYLFAAQLGLDPETAQIVAIAFLIVGLVDYLALRFWDRLMPPPS